MGATTGIEWAHSTVNIWEGCTKVSPACRGCYAETDPAVRVMQARIGEALGVEPDASGKRRLRMWGVSGFRYETANWEAQLRAMNRKAAKMRTGHASIEGTKYPYERPRVFINSLSDTFEDWSGPVYRLEDGKPVVVAQSLDDVRERFFNLIDVGELDELDLLLVTKRPENVMRMIPKHWRGECSSGCSGTLGHQRRNNGNAHSMPRNIWIGTTVEDQEHADKRIPELIKVPAKVRFLSVEPLLESVRLTGEEVETDNPIAEGAQYVIRANPLNGRAEVRDVWGTWRAGGDSVEARIHWVIVGGESGTNARPMRPDWVRSIRDQCQAAGVPFFFKQWGEWARPIRYVDADAWVESDGTVYRNPGKASAAACPVAKVGKKAAGRILDGRTWDEVPK